jgi:hypothetical protein
MTHHTLTPFRSSLLNLLLLVPILFLLVLTAQAQTSQTTTDKLTPSGLAPGAPAGSYPLSGFENINLFNGNLDLRLPLIALDGRGLGSAQHDGFDQYQEVASTRRAY